MTTYTPSLSEVRKMTGRGNVVPVYREVRADLETPVSAFLKVARGPYSFLLESVEGGERQGRYSFIGTEPYRVYGAKHEDGDPLTVVQQEMARFQSVEVPGLPRFHGGAVGYLGYEAVTHFEPRVPLGKRDVLGVPESWLMFTDTLLVFDHVKHTIKAVSHVRLDGDIDAAYRQGQAKIDELIERLERMTSSRRCGARRSTSPAATSSRSCCRSASRARPARTRSRCTAACAPSTHRRTCCTCSSVRPRSWGRRRNSS